MQLVSARKQVNANIAPKETQMPAFGTGKAFAKNSVTSSIQISHPRRLL
jgi:hypothetical protein